VPYRERGRLHVPWTIRGSLDASNALRRRQPADVTFFPTQSIGLFASHAVGGRKYAISVDATPRQLDSMGMWYGHHRSRDSVEAMKRALYRRVLQRASFVVAWSDWARTSLVDDYGVAGESISVVHPGASAAFFSLARVPSPRPTILFVGGDFERKGGPLLLEVFARAQDRADLLLVTSAPVEERPGLRVVSDATPGSVQLLAAYASADIFCLPTYGDCTSVAVEEAMAAGLPVVTTGVGSNASTVRDGCSGIIVPTGSAEALNVALSRLIDDPALRTAMGAHGRDLAAKEMDADKNAIRIVSLMRSAAS
ncbi:MAG: glycosyltransferase family 4 protein, partial [Tepidiformaceae bacterium]